jgi:D-serine deaminase-like pyridoxal phosphate-dependent protein
MQLQPASSAKGIIVSTLAEAEFFFAGGQRNITFGSPVIPWCARVVIMQPYSDAAAVSGTLFVVCLCREQAATFQCNMLFH